jgi:hypothetical protein
MRFDISKTFLDVSFGYLRLQYPWKWRHEGLNTVNASAQPLHSNYRTDILNNNLSPFWGGGRRCLDARRWFDKEIYICILVQHFPHHITLWITIKMPEYKYFNQIITLILVSINLCLKCDQYYQRHFLTKNNRALHKNISSKTKKFYIY